MAWQAGLLDVDAMRNNMTVKQADMWNKAYATGRLDDGWQQAAMVASEIRNLPVRLCCWFFGHKMKAEELVAPEDFLPKSAIKIPAKEKKPSDFAARLASQFGK